MYARMKFGKHKGCLVSELPSSYLAWMLKEVRDLDIFTRRAAETVLRDRERAEQPPREEPASPPPEQSRAVADLRGVVRRTQPNDAMTAKRKATCKVGA